jgi:hypothetical protein
VDACKDRSATLAHENPHPLKDSVGFDPTGATVCAGLGADSPPDTISTGPESRVPGSHEVTGKSGPGSRFDSIETGSGFLV